jgi:shikimate dehydrogenase
MKRFGLLGKTLTHSFSKKYFTEKFEKLGLKDHVYELFEIPQIEAFPQLIKSQSPLSGMNVTIPYKEQVLPYLTELDISAQRVGAVNVIKFDQNGVLKGYNSDYYGFKNSLLNALKLNNLDIPKFALILGTGGAAKAVLATLADLNIDYKIVSREQGKADLTYQDLNEDVLKNHTLIVNASPVGTYPKVDDFPDIPYQYLTKEHLLFDLVYNPELTQFMQKGIENGAKAINGLEMLHLQAEKAWEIWNS